MALNALLKRQAEIKKAAVDLEKKFAKVSEANRKESYFTRRLGELKAIWNEFEENNVAIEECEGTSEEREIYETDGTYKKVTDLMKKAKAMYETAYKQKFPEKPLVDIFDEREKPNRTILVQDDEKNEELTRKTFTVRSAMVIELGNKIMSKIDDLNTVIELDHELGKIVTALDNYMIAFEAMILLAVDDYEVEGVKLEHEDVTNIADRVILMCKSKMARKTTEPEAPKLQALKVPKFRGECLQWVPFLNLFTKVVKENVKLSNVQKLQYLMDSLENEPRKLIQHLDICDENFESAMDILMRRYNDQRRIVNNHIDAILDLPVAADDAKGLKVIHDTFIEGLYALKGQQVTGKTLGETVLVRIIEKKLDTKTRQHFEESLNEKRKIPKLDALMQFIEERFISMESASSEQRRENHGQLAKSANKKECVVCHGQHSMHQCAKFNRMTPHERNESVRKANLCRNCLRTHSGKCNLSANCNKCKGYHHVALHYEKRREYNNEQRHDAQVHVTHTDKNEFDVMLATAIIKAKNRDGEYIELRALIDQGSTISFVSEDAIQKLKLSRVRNSTVVTGIGAGKTESIHGSTNICIKPRYPSTFETSIEALILSKLTTYENVADQKWRHVSELTLADPEYWKCGAIDVILGADIFGMIVLDGVIRGPVNTPVAQETIFGWILSGRIRRASPQNNMVSLVSNGCLSHQLEKFWTTEELRGDDVTNLTKEEKMCQEFYSETVRRNRDGKYVTRLPFKASDVGLGRSRHIAVATLLQMEKSEYAKCINEYLELGHMELARESDEALISIEGGEKCYKCYYLPHHAVIKSSSTTTKLRVVFNASQKTSNGVSLNELMMINDHTG